MANDTLIQLKKIVSSDQYDLESSRLVQKLAEKWDLAEASENLSKHLVIAGFITDLTEAVKLIDQQLQDQDIVDEKTIKWRFKLKADRQAYIRFLNIFNGNAKRNLENEANRLKAKADAQGGAGSLIP